MGTSSRRRPPGPLSIVVPARNEADSVGTTVRRLVQVLSAAGLEHEILVVDDGSDDATAAVVRALESPQVRYVRSPHAPGFGSAVRAGLERFSGDAVAIVMADGSDDPHDLLVYESLLRAGYDCAFGSRFVPGARRRGYPWPKLVLNRAANLLIRALFRHGYNDTTNAFKAYTREVIASVHPLRATDFSLTVELPVKAILRGHTYAVVPISWSDRSAGASKLRLPEMGSRYVVTVARLFAERLRAG